MGLITPSFAYHNSMLWACNQIKPHPNTYHHTISIKMHLTRQTIKCRYARQDKTTNPRWTTFLYNNDIDFIKRSSLIPSTQLKAKINTQYHCPPNKWPGCPFLHLCVCPGYQISIISSFTINVIWPFKVFIAESFNLHISSHLWSLILVQRRDAHKRTILGRQALKCILQKRKDEEQQRMRSRRRKARRSRRI